MRKGSIQGYRSAFAAFGAFLCLSSADVLSQPDTEIKAISQDIHVVVQNGDNLSSIVRRVMGSSEFWEEVATLNKISSPDALKPGDMIIFPGDLVQKRNFARVAFVKGNVMHTSAASNTTAQLEKRDKVFLGDVIKTGEDGFVSLSFNGESLANIQPESHVQFIEFDCFDVEKSCVVNLLAEEGQMNFDIQNIGFKKPSRFSIDTPYASAAVRGTNVDVEVNDGSAIGVTTGVIEVTSGNDTSTLPIGKGTLAGEGRSITRLYDLLEKPVYNPFIRLSREDYVAWAPVEGAETYSVVLATSESLSEVIRSSRSAQSYTVLLSEPQEYYLGTRALDENGLKGFKGIQKINQVSVDENAEAPPLDIELSENDLTIVNTGKVTTEVHVGSALEPADGLDQLLRYTAYDIAAGQTLELDVNPNQDVYITARAVVGPTAVSSYGSIYEFTGRKK